MFIAYDAMISLDMIGYLSMEYGFHRLPQTRRVLDEAIIYGEKLGLFHLTQDLRELIVPFDREDKQIWDEFNINLKNIWQAYRDLYFTWEFSIEDHEALGSYIWMNELLVDCLAVSRVRDREAVYEWVFKPPPAPAVGASHSG